MGLRDLFWKRGRENPTPERRFSLVIAGHGVEITPWLPFGCAHLEGGTLLFGPVDREHAKLQTGGVKNVLVKTDEGGPAELVLGRDMGGYEAVLEDFRETDGPEEWTIVTDDHEIQWPAHFTVRASGNPSPRRCAYELVQGKALIFLQGPLRGRERPVPEQLVAPGMEIVDEGSFEGAEILWFELAYQHEGAPWRQRFYYLPIDPESLYLLRAQAEEQVTDDVFEAADLVAASFRRR